MTAIPDDPNVYEAFAQFGKEKPIQHVGSVRAGDPILAWQAAKEAYTRRQQCTLLWVAPRCALVMSTEEDAVVLGAGKRMAYRLPSFPSKLRREGERAQEGPVS